MYFSVLKFCDSIEAFIIFCYIAKLIMYMHFDQEGWDGQGT